MRVPEITEENLTNEIIDRLLFEGLEDTGERADCIIVLGSTSAVKYRVPKAVEVYINGRSDKIMMCGGAMKNILGEHKAEAEHMRDKALELGVPEESIIMEENSENGLGNIVLYESNGYYWVDFEGGNYDYNGMFIRSGIDFIDENSLNNIEKEFIEHITWRKIHDDRD